MATAFKFVSKLETVIRDIDKGSKRNLIQAAKHVVKKMKKKVGVRYSEDDASPEGSPPGRRSDSLRKGIRWLYESRFDRVFVGTRAPAYHAHLMEFGTVDRYQKRSGKFAGRVEERPFFAVTFVEEQQEVVRIMQEPWIK